MGTENYTLKTQFMKETSFKGNKKAKEYFENTFQTTFTMNMSVPSKMTKRMDVDSFDGERQGTLTKGISKRI